MTPDLRHHSIRWWVAAAAALMLTLLAVALPARSHGAVTKATSSYYQINGTSPVSGLKLTGYDGKNVYVAVQVTGASATVSVPTAAQAGLTLPFGYTSFSGSQIAFTGPAANANAALKALTIVSPNIPYAATGNANDVTLTVTAFEEKAGLTYYPQNQHFYRFVEGKVPWTAVTCQTESATCVSSAGAKALAAQSTELGQTGYLATITDAGENDFVTSKIPGAVNVWVGASDADPAENTEGDWKWVTGPEAGTVFFRGCETSATARTGTVVTYANWATNEPNNWLGSSCSSTTAHQEDCAVTNWSGGLASETSGFWNDLACNYVARNGGTHAIGGYVAEYGNKPVGGDFAGVDIVSSTFKSRPYVPKVKANFFDKVFKLVFTSKKRKNLPKKVDKPATFTFKTKLQMVNPGTYVLTIKRKDGAGVPYLLLPGSKAQAAGRKAVTLGSSRWSIEVTTTKANQRVTIDPVLKTMDWVKPAGTKVSVQLKTDSNMRCPLGWCESTPIPSPRDQGKVK